MSDAAIESRWAELDRRLDEIASARRSGRLDPEEAREMSRSAALAIGAKESWLNPATNGRLDSEKFGAAMLVCRGSHLCGETGSCRFEPSCFSGPTKALQIRHLERRVAELEAIVRKLQERAG